jgi:serine/threonine-protein kinase
MTERFELLGELGRGGMATVHLALDHQTGQQVALKVLHAHLADRPSTRRRLERELEAALRVAHPAILHPLERVEVDGVPALVLPALSGQTLADRVEQEGPLDAVALQHLLEQVGGALAAAHGAGVLHRDITPNNVLWDDGEPRLVDFGLARLADQGTATTGALGTVGYAAPEAYTEGCRDPRSDAYSLGAVLFFAATGRPPFDAPTAMGALTQQLDGRHTPLADLRPEVPASLAHTIEALLAPDLEQRPSVPAALRLRARLVAVETPRTRLQWTQVGSLVSLVALVAIGWVQDVGAFLLATVIQGHGVPSPDIHEMTQGVSALLLLPLALLPALVGAVVGRDDPERRLAPWMGIAALAVLDLLYALAAGVLLPAWGMSGQADLFGTMLYHQGAFVVLAAVIVVACRPWRSLTRVQVLPPVVRAPLADEARAALASLAAALKTAPAAVQADLSELVRDLSGAVDELAAELVTVELALQDTSADPARLATLEARLARSAAHGEPTADLERALAAQRDLLAQADALDARRVRAVASLLEVQVETAHARRTLLELDEPGAVTDALAAVRTRARLAAAAALEVG